MKGMLGRHQGAWSSFAITATTTEVTIPFWTARLSAMDQTGAPIPGAQLLIHKREGSVAPGGAVTMPKGVKVHVRGVLGNHAGPWREVTFTEGAEVVTIPFWTARLSAMDQTGAPIPGAQLLIHKREGSVAPGGAVTMPKGVKVHVRGVLGNHAGPWREVTFTEGAEVVTIPFWTARLSAMDQTGAPIPGAQLLIHKREGSVAPGGAVTMPKGVKVHVRGVLGNHAGPWREVTFTEGAEVVTIPFWTARLSAADQNGAPVLNAFLRVYKLEGLVASGQTVTVPKGITLPVQGIHGQLSGPWKKVVFVDGADPVIIPF